MDWPPFYHCDVCGKCERCWPYPIYQPGGRQTVWGCRECLKGRKEPCDAPSFAGCISAALMVLLLGVFVWRLVDYLTSDAFKQSVKNWLGIE